MFEFLVYVAAAASILAALVYIRSMFRGQTKPNRVTWFMWSVAPFVATAASLFSGAGLAALPVFMSGFGPFLIFTASFFSKKAYWRLSAFDYACGAFSGLALVLWYFTSNPNVAIGFAIVSDASAAIPTLIKAWRNPESESIWPYLVGLFAPMTSFLVAPAWVFSALAFPTYLVAINVVLVASVSKGRLAHKSFKRNPANNPTKTATTTTAITKRGPNALALCMSRSPIATNKARTPPAKMDVVMGTSGYKSTPTSGTIKTGSIKLRIINDHLPVHNIPTPHVC
ncbi:MAG: hypothetical protein ACQCN6_07670 [Candidatus Bathyarchaeia archaeon]|jgi:hypothetical protein